MYKTLRSKHKIKASQHGVGNDFLDMTPKAHATKEKIVKLGFIKTLKTCKLKDIINRVKRQPTEWENTFANHASSRGLISRIYTELLELNNNNTNPTQKWAKDLNRHFSKEDIHMANRHEHAEYEKNAQHHLSLGKC